MQTEKLYYQDPHLREFTATILEKSALADGQFAIILDRTAFYPEGGGQPCDTGSLNEAPVLSVQMRNGEIIHTVACDPGDGPVDVADAVCDAGEDGFEVGCDGLGSGGLEAVGAGLALGDEIAAGVVPKWMYLARFYGMSEEDAQEAMPEQTVLDTGF